jgi:hypothetical protein
MAKTIYGGDGGCLAFVVMIVPIVAALMLYGAGLCVIQLWAYCF